MIRQAKGYGRPAQSSGSVPPAQSRIPVSSALETNLQTIQSLLGNSADLVIRKLKVGSTRAAIAFINGLANRFMIESQVVKPLLQKGESQKVLSLPWVRDQGVSVAEVYETSDLKQGLARMLSGDTLLMSEGWNKLLVLSARGWEKRAVEEPATEAVVRGPREGFAEDLQTNTSLVRRRLHSDKLRVKNLTIGSLTRTPVSLLYIEGVADPAVLSELEERLGRIKIDGILESGYIEEFIEDSPFSPFPQVVSTERPDRVAAALLQGQVAIMIDGTPMVLIVPSNFFNFLHSPEDYYDRWPVIIGIRLFRFMGFTISLIIPALYVALTTYHQEMIPTSLAVSLVAQREQVPYPAVVEALIMQFTFELLIEAGVRLPRPIGQFIGIVGALVIGEAAVRAGLISAAMVIVISLTAIASFAVPSPAMVTTVRMLRLPMIILAAVMGLFGIFTGLLLILIHLCSLHSFGTAYFAPWAPFIGSDQRDVVLRVPWWAMKKRPLLPAFRNLIRLGNQPLEKMRAVGEREMPEAEAKISDRDEESRK